MRASIRRRSSPSGLCTLTVSIAPNCTARAAVCVWVNKSDTVSESGFVTVGVVSDAPADVLRVGVTVQLVRSAYGLHAPSSCTLKLKFQSAPRWIVDDVWTATIIPKALLASNFAPSRSTRRLIPRPAATLWQRPLRLALRAFLAGNLARPQGCQNVPRTL